MVLDLQQACLDEKVSCYYLLLKAYAIAEKLSIKDMAEFCSNEINGYFGFENKRIPQYRHIYVNTEAYKETSKRWEPVSFPAGHPRSKRFIAESVAEIEKLTTPTDLARVANLIYNCNQFVVKRHTKFSDWMREFFKIIGVRCPKDLHENKYTPNATFKNRFYFLPYNDQARDN